MQSGTVVMNKTVIQSDDREVGIEDGTPIIPIGTKGVILGMSKDFMEPDTSLKEGCEDCVVVAFELTTGKYNFDVHPVELTLGG